MRNVIAIAVLLIACSGNGAAGSPEPVAVAVAPCIIGGCSGQICASEPLASTCEWLPEYACYRTARCEPQTPGGACGWTQTPDLLACISAARGPLQGAAGSPEPAVVVAPCVVGGCSGQLCGSEPLVSTCEWLPEYACYRTARCEPQTPGGACGWTQTPDLLACISAARGR